MTDRSETTSKQSASARPSAQGSKASAARTRRTKGGKAAKATTAKPAAQSAKPGGAFAAGAARASGERRRRVGTPLLPVSEPVELSAARRDAVSGPAHQHAEPAKPVPAKPVPAKPVPATPERDSSRAGDTGSEAMEPETGQRERPGKASVAEVAKVGVGARTPGDAVRRRPTRSAVRQAAGRPRTATTGGPAAGSTQSVARPNDGARLLRSVGPDETTGTGTSRSLETPASSSWTSSITDALADPSRIVGAVLEAAECSSRIKTDPAELVDLAVNVLRAAASSTGLPTEEVERQVAEGLAYLRRRLTGDYTVDEFGFDEDFTRHIYLPLLRPLYKRWFRVEVKGVENIPTTGGALVVANHSGTVALDSVMTQVAVHDEHPEHRHLRMLGADLVFQMPFIGAMARRSGSTLAANTDAERLLAKGELVGVWPEGFKGVGKPFSERYKLQRFGRGGFVAAALRAGVPIVPCSIVGAEEIYPIIGNLPTVARLLGLPYVPITPTFPLLGLLGLIPLPSKWLIEFGAPIDTAGFGTDAADDPMLVFDLTDQVRETIQQTLYSLLMQRKSVFI